VLRDGVDVRTLAEYLGHSDPAFTLRVYCHLMPGSPDRVRQAIDRTFSEARIARRSPRRAKQACDLRRYHFTKI
jgi:hypothetical protein